MHRSLLRAAAAASAALVTVATWGAPASAAASLTQVSLSVTVRGQYVETRAVIRSDVTTTVDRYLVCVRDSAGKNMDFSPKPRDVTISTTGTAYTATRIFPNHATYRYYPCVYAHGTWARVGPAKSFDTDTDYNPGISMHDDFSGPAGQPYDSGTWAEFSACTYNKSAATGSTDCGSDETLDGKGHLRIPADPTHGSAITTKDDLYNSFPYAEMSAWIKVPPQPGYRAYFGTSNNNPSGVDSLPFGTVDVLDAYTTRPSAFRTGTHTVNGDLSWGSPGSTSCAQVDLSAAFHKYTTRIDIGTVTFFLDDVQCGEVATRADSGGKPYGLGPHILRPSWMTLSLAVGGGQQKPPTAPATMLVDRVEVRWIDPCPSPTCCRLAPDEEC